MTAGRLDDQIWDGLVVQMFMVALGADRLMGPSLALVRLRFYRAGILPQGLRLREHLEA